MNKVYKLKNGYSLSKGTFYDGYKSNTRWCIYSPNGELYMSCVSYKEAYELASHLIPDNQS
jgi:hypothetical protein